MPDNPVPNPHDQLFKETFSRKDTAAAFFQSYLPKAVVSRVDWETLQLQPGQFVDQDLQGRQSDLLYTVELDGNSVLLYCLFEHQSSPDTWMPLRLLRYILGIWEQARKQNPKAVKLPPVLPIVLFQGGAPLDRRRSVFRFNRAARARCSRAEPFSARFSPSAGRSDGA